MDSNELFWCWKDNNIFYAISSDVVYFISSIKGKYTFCTIKGFNIEFNSVPDLIGIDNVIKRINHNDNSNEIKAKFKTINKNGKSILLNKNSDIFFEKINNSLINKYERENDK